MPPAPDRVLPSSRGNINGEFAGITFGFSDIGTPSFAFGVCMEKKHVFFGKLYSC